MENTFAWKVQEHRRRRTLTQAQLAERAGLGERTIQDIEAGRIRKPRRDTLNRLVAGLELSPDEQAELFASLHPLTSLESGKTSPTKSAHNDESSPFSVPVKGETPASPVRHPRSTFLLTSATHILSLPRTRTIFIAISVLFAGLGLAAAVLLYNTLLREPSCPHPTGTGVMLFEHACYGGRQLTLYESDDELCDNALDTRLAKVEPCYIAPSWNDSISSVWIGPGYRASFHLHSPKDSGDVVRTFECNQAIPDLSKWWFRMGQSMNENISRVVITQTDCR